jgi:hypothetical protein
MLPKMSPLVDIRLPHGCAIFAAAATVQKGSMCMGQSMVVTATNKTVTQAPEKRKRIEQFQNIETPLKTG